MKCIRLFGMNWIAQRGPTFLSLQIGWARVAIHTLPWSYCRLRDRVSFTRMYK